MDDINILTKTKRLLDKDGRSLQAIARESGIPFSTLRYIKTGSTKFPRFDTLMKLSSFLGASK